MIRKLLIWTLGTIFVIIGTIYAIWGIGIWILVHCSSPRGCFLW